MNGVSLIVLAEGDPAQLERLLGSFSKKNTYRPTEWIIADRTGGERISSLIGKLAVDHFIRYVRLESPCPAALARALAVKRARYDTLVFVSDKIVYGTDVLPTVMSRLAEPAVGVLGVCLEEVVKTGPEFFPTGVCRAGMTFAWDRTTHCFHPVPVRRGPPDVPDSGGAHPAGHDTGQPIAAAVSADFLACRRGDFEDAGGFCTEYQEHLHDIELCLQIEGKLRKRICCDPELWLQLETRASGSDDPGNECDEAGDLAVFRRRMGKTVSDRMHAVGKSPSAGGSGVTTPALPALRVLFVLPGVLDSNSGYHAAGVARSLLFENVECAFAVPSVSDLPLDDVRRFPVQTYAELLQGGPGFVDGWGPDIVHAWTPRENVRRFCKELLSAYPAKTVIHLEDNEEHLTISRTGKSWEQLQQLDLSTQDRLIPPDRYHPSYGPAWLASADGISLVIAQLNQFNTSGKPSIVIPPVVDERLFYPRPVNRSFRAKLEIPDSDIVIVYSGNVHLANVNEVRALYEAVNILNEQGCAVTLIRTGIDPPWLKEQPWPGEHHIALGWVPRNALPDVLAAADLFVQPGESDPFNDLRVPSKLPEFFAMGRPVILPKTNLGLVVDHGQHAYLLDTADAASIAAAIVDLRNDPGLRQRLALGAAAFYRSRFNTSARARELFRFYARLCPPRGLDAVLAA